MGSTYVEDRDLVDALALRIRLCGQVLVDVFEVRDRHILFELLVKDNIVVNELNLSI